MSNENAKFSYILSFIKDYKIFPEQKTFFNCSKGRCNRIFRTKTNAEQHFCWNVKKCSTGKKDIVLRKLF
jgi:hypothetical protein